MRLRPDRAWFRHGVVLFSLTAAVCQPSPSATPDPAKTPLETEAGGILVTRDDPAFPPACRPGAVARTIVGFLAALEQGKIWTAARSVATDKDFGWYSVTDEVPPGSKRHFVAYRRDKLLPYLEQRHRRAERMRLLSVDVDYERAGHLGHIAYVVRRVADDLQPLGIRGTLAGGKGAIECDGGTIAIWSMAMQAAPDPHPESLCPRPDLALTDSVVVACARA